MSGIRDIEKLNIRQMEAAKRRGEREIKAMNDAHQAYRNELSKSHDGEIIEIQDQHHRQLNVEAEKKEKILAGMRDHLQKTTDITDKQLKDLKQNAENEKVETQRKLSVDRERLVSEHELYLDELNERYNTSARKVNHEGKQRIEDMKLEMGKQFSDQEAFNTSKLNEQSNNFNERFKTEGLHYKKMKDDQDNHFKKERMATNGRQQVEMSKLTETHNHELERRDDNYRKGLKDQDLFFEDKYKATFDRHNEAFKKLDEDHKKVVESMKSNLTKEITQAANRRDDSFYDFVALKPRMKSFPDRVEIEVDVPEHAKQDLQLTINNKEAVVNFNRRYSDANKTPEGAINKINKVESFSTRLQTGMVLNPKSVKSTYEGGTMTYVIAKA